MKSNRTINAYIFARGGSKGVKDKNIREVAGKPLIHYSIECAKQSGLIDKVIVSTDSDRIAEVASVAGAEILIRPAELATDKSPEILSWKHATECFESDIFVSLPATSPLRTTEDLREALSLYEAGNYDIVFGITESHRNPYLNMVTKNSDATINVVCGDEKAIRRQDVPEVFDITTCVYVTSPNYINSCRHLMEGRVGAVNIPVERSLDIDTEFDMYLADLMLKNPYKNQGKTK